MSLQSQEETIIWLMSARFSDRLVEADLKTITMDIVRVIRNVKNQKNCVRGRQGVMSVIRKYRISC